MRIVVRAASVLSAGFLSFASEGWALITVGALETPNNYAVEVAVAGDLAYVADYRSGLRVIDVSDPTLPVALRKQGGRETGGTFLPISVVGVTDIHPSAISL